jgi:hypothetical protein
MKRSELEHVLRASAAITLENSFVVIGSQAVLLDFPDAPAAGRDKDADWVRALLRHGMIGLDRLVERLSLLDASQHPPAPLIAWARRRAEEARA